MTGTAHDYSVGNIIIDHPFAAPTPPVVKVAAGYLIITNTGTKDDVLLGGTASFADAVSMHISQLDGDIVRMRRVEDGLLIPAGESIALEPGGHHVMFEGLQAQLVLEERHTATLMFRDAGETNVEFVIEHATEAQQIDHSAMHD